ncbi:hypothetical protein ABKN59_000788 [Abortiporus biennis]
MVNGEISIRLMATSSIGRTARTCEPASGVPTSTSSSASTDAGYRVVGARRSCEECPYGRSTAVPLPDRIIATPACVLLPIKLPPCPGYATHRTENSFCVFQVEIFAVGNA